MFSSVLFICKKFREMAEWQNIRMHVQNVLEQLFDDENMYKTIILVTMIIF
jgi:hypothetical protein